MDRFHRQTILPDFGDAARERLASAHAMIIGCGALGCPAADLLCRAGVGRLSIVDRDVVELTNLQRQTLFDERDAAEAAPKAEAAARRLRTVHAGARIDAIVEDFAGPDAERIVSPNPAPGVLLDCTDNFETRYLVNDVSVKLGIPYVYAGAVGTAGMVMCVIPGRSACLRCVFPDPPAPGTAPTCDTAGILGPVAAMIGARQSIEAIKFLIGRADLALQGVWSIDPWHNTGRHIGAPRAGALDAERPAPGGRRADCPCCAQRRFEFLDARGPEGEGARVLCGRNSVQVAPARRSGSKDRPEALDLAALESRLARSGTFTRGTHHLRGRLTAESRPLELTVFSDGRAIIGGTIDPVEARAVYARYVGC
ncbi:MAG: ThiF family adenylyltransferase [Phycisphaerales bacterium]